MYLAIGNHEFTGYQSYEPAMTQFLKHLRLPEEIEKPADVPYYDTWINGYHFIVLGNTVYEPGVRATIGVEQYAWLEDKLGEATDDRPIFLFMHQGMMNTVSGTAESERWWGINDDSRLRELLKEYPNVFFFTGHTHSMMDAPNCMYGGGKKAALFNTGSVGDLWVPSTGESIVGSQGLYVQVYGDKVLVRGRDFTTGQWVASAQFVVNERYSIPADATALEAEIAAVEALTPNDYTAESWVALSEALTAAKAATSSRSQAEIDAALASLKTAREALVTVSAEPVTPTEPTEHSGMANTLLLVLVPVVLVCAVSVVIVLCLKKRK
jgi:hypothetical protein